MKKVLVRLFLLLGLVSFSSIAYAANGVIYGDGSEANPYLIEDCSDLRTFASSVNASKYWSTGVYTRLATDIDMTPCNSGYIIDVHALVANHYDEQPAEKSYYRIGINETVIDDPHFSMISNEGNIYLPAIVYNGTEYADINTLEQATGYSGVFDGAGFSISGFVILHSSGSYNSFCGLFGRINRDGVVRNLNVNDVDIITGRSSTGGICGENNGLIENCAVSGRITNGTAIGGVCGVNNGLILNCSFAGMVQAINGAGGIAGINYGVIDQCCVNAKVRAKSYAGGIAGINGDYENGAAAYIIDSYAFGAVYATMAVMCYDVYGYYKTDCFFVTMVDNHYAGGITALNVAGKVEDCYCSVYDNDGEAYSGFYRYTGLVGRELEGTTETSYWENYESASQTELSFEEMVSASTWINAGWDDVNTWIITDLSYPMLANTPLVDNWLTLVDISPVIYTVQTEIGATVLSFDSPTPVSAILLKNGEEVEDEYSLSWEMANTENRNTLKNCYYINDGVLYNTNETQSDVTIKLRAKISIDNRIYSGICSVVLQNGIKTQTAQVVKAKVNASSRRDNPRDSIYVKTKGFLSYPTEIVDGMERDATLKVEIFEEGNDLFVPIVKTFEIQENISNYRNSQHVTRLKVITDRGSIIRFNFDRSLRCSIVMSLKNLDLTGMKSGFTIRLSNDMFCYVINASDTSDRGKSVILPSDINGKGLLPISLLENISTNIHLNKTRIIQSGKRSKGAFAVSGKFSLSEEDDFLISGLSMKLGPTTLSIAQNQLYFKDQLNNEYTFDLDSPVITEVREGVYAIKFNCGKNGVLPANDRSEKLFSINALFDSRTQNYRIRVSNIEYLRTTVITEEIKWSYPAVVELDIAPFKNGYLTSDI